jgi:arsenate reductase
MTVTIYHNPRCGTSRTTLALIQGVGIEPEIVEYLNQPPIREALAGMIAAAGLSVRAALRVKEPRYVELGLENPTLSDEALLDAMVAYPILINRPFVMTPLGARLCRPAERVLEILPAKAASTHRERSV